jgi:hypothetical protein
MFEAMIFVDLLRQFVVKTKKFENLLLAIFKMEEGFFHFIFQITEGRKVMKMNLSFLDFLPELFNRIIIRGVRGQIIIGYPIRMLLEEHLHDLTRVVPGAIMNKDDMHPGILHNLR